jgi:anti-sigma regulatory factor (Ser/Thr protein kinase)
VSWEKRIGSRAGRGPWREDFPLNRELPEELVVDCTELLAPVHPMVLLRLRVFVDWHRHAGRVVRITVPRDAAAASEVVAMGMTDETAADAMVVLPVTRLADHRDVEIVALGVRELLEFEMIDVSPLGEACYMAVSELCGNAVEHGRNEGGYHYVAAVRRTEPRRLVSLAIGDLGIGIPEHLRQREPELTDDDYAIARAMQPRVSGTGHPHRGNGFSETFEAALTSTLHAARIEVYSGRGLVRREVVQNVDLTQTFPAANPRRGTWITYDLLAATG